MKYFLSMAAIACTLGLVACETTNTAGGGNQEAKRRAAIERQKQQAPLDESRANLLNAQQNNLDRDSNPLRAY